MNLNVSLLRAVDKHREENSVMRSLERFLLLYSEEQGDDLVLRLVKESLRPDLQANVNGSKESG